MSVRIRGAGISRLPLVFNRADLLIHQSANREGVRKEPDIENFQVPPSNEVADDLTYNDFTGGELRDLGAIFSVKPFTPEFLIWAEFNDIFSVGKFLASDDHQAVIDGLTNDFRRGRNGQEREGVAIGDNFDPALYATPPVMP